MAPHANVSKNGHPESFCVDCTSFQSTFISALIQSPHFPEVRKMQELIYKVAQLTYKIFSLDKALEEGDIQVLRNICDDMKENQKSYEYEVSKIDLDEDRIVATHEEAFKNLYKMTPDVPMYAFVCCEGLNFARDMTKIANMRKLIDTAICAEVMKDAQKNEIRSTFLRTALPNCAKV